MLYKTSPIVSKRLYDRTETNSIDNLESSGHSWSPVAQAVWKHPVDKPLLRTWDDLSGSQPDGSGDMSARASDIPLTTFEARRSSHQTHIIHRNWTPTPYISFTSSPEALENLASQLQKVSPQKKASDSYCSRSCSSTRVRLAYHFLWWRKGLLPHCNPIWDSTLGTQGSPPMPLDSQSRRSRSALRLGQAFSRTPTGIIILSARISRGFVKKGSAGSRNRFNIG